MLFPKFRLVALALLAPLVGYSAEPEAATIAHLRAQELDDSLSIGYAVSLTDLNQDAHLDIVVVDKHRVVWYANPGKGPGAKWERGLILQGKTKPDNVCVVPIDIDGDGDTDLVLGADWNPGNTKSGGSLQWLEHPGTLGKEWQLYSIDEEPTVHRVCAGDLDGDKKPEIILAPLFGRDSNRSANWLDGRPVRLLAYKIPDDPKKGPWKAEPISEELHVSHNVLPVDGFQGEPTVKLLAASYEGVSTVSKTTDGWKTRRIGEGDQRDPKSSRGASEIKSGTAADGTSFLATIEPWHGNQVVVYTPPKSDGTWKRHVLDESLNGGHAVWCADMDGEKGDELIIGSRLKAGEGDVGQWGLRIFKAKDLQEGLWTRQLVDPGGVAVEDAAAADLNGDGRVDIVAVGRATKNVRIYWNGPFPNDKP